MTRRKRRQKWGKKRELSSPHEEPQTFEPDTDMPGSIYMVPDRLWGFEAVGRTAHPGACMVVNSERKVAVFIKGCGATNARRRGVMMTLDPTTLNGLKKRTVFDLAPRKFRLNQVALLHHERRLGELTRDEHIKALNHLMRLFPVDEESS